MVRADPYMELTGIVKAANDGAVLFRGAELTLDETERPKIDPEFEEVTEGEEVERKEKLKTKWAQLEAVASVGRSSDRVAPAGLANHPCAQATEPMTRRADQRIGPASGPRLWPARYAAQSFMSRRRRSNRSVRR